MCLGIPGEVVRWLEKDPLLARAEIRFGDLSRVCHMACVPDALVGDYVVVHAGIAISKIDPVEARRVFEELDRLEIEQELRPVLQQDSERRGGPP
jgi:hydrogenase expression/formation protein HypC